MDQILTEIESIRKSLFVFYRRVEQQRIALDEIGIELFSLRDDLQIVLNDATQLELDIA